ncbi:DcrB-related protein [Trinickia caryophylli]|uniref:DUF1795 domain-containing protein n=1 Tax=Trinickia caryophylli TaxID=28094 RepID=A0A1X7H3S1_TRICW|nr:DcrB-related protein [Trinickia caryophylli]PMS10051.1 DUF1795 domain-containing protein [Trinickia caryophylli]TRX18408.1 DUF1795 domain-containing protein [Trinickia caryophylli]WQE10807.1 DcrB-related protein [Trinickia caryophylli]SMF78710.1 hypothetical protein SAMN06295900_120133 [Trinickia caryophylli]GLU35883.1 hypothetical protein Busp01_57250 [Trinickia caryophylli]
MYRIQEGTLSIPEEWIDKTMNVFVSASTGTEGVSFVVTRESLPWGMRFDEYTANEVQKLAKQMPDYQLIGGEPAEVNGRAAYTHEYRWKNNGMPLHQLLTMVEYGKRVLMLTFTVPGSLSDTQRVQVRQIVESLELNAPN